MPRHMVNAHLQDPPFCTSWDVEERLLQVAQSYVPARRSDEHILVELFLGMSPRTEAVRWSQLHRPYLEKEGSQSAESRETDLNHH